MSWSSQMCWGWTLYRRGGRPGVGWAVRRVEEEGLDEEDDEDEDERVRTQSEDVRHIIQEATTVFVNEWQLANENEDSGEDSYRHSEESYSDVEEEEEEVEAVKDKDA